MGVSRNEQSLCTWGWGLWPTWSPSLWEDWCMSDWVGMYTVLFMGFYHGLSLCFLRVCFVSTRLLSHWSSCSCHSLTPSMAGRQAEFAGWKWFAASDIMGSVSSPPFSSSGPDSKAKSNWMELKWIPLNIIVVESVPVRKTYQKLLRGRECDRGCGFFVFTEFATCELELEWEMYGGWNGGRIVCFLNEVGVANIAWESKYPTTPISTFVFSPLTIRLHQGRIS